MTNNIRLDDELRREYTRLFNTCEVHPQHETAVIRLADRIFGQQSRYAAISALTRVPWFVIAGIHMMETGLRFDRHLHNGDPLTARTTHVPRQRPPGEPPFTWEESAVDALRYDNMVGWSDWSLAGTLYKMEGFNGWGYRKYHASLLSPYLWSFSNHYEKGKYGADGVFDPDLVSEQCGIATLFKFLEQNGRELFEERGVEPAPAATATAPYPGRTIRQGEYDSAPVKRIQQRLNGLGCADPPLLEDGDFGSLTEAAVRLFQARSVDPSGEPLLIDGRVGPLTWDALFGRGIASKSKDRAPELPLLTKLLETAAGQIGVCEDPPGSNRGKQVEAYLASVGLGPGSPWCAAFVYWCFQQASAELGIDNPCIKTGGVLDHWNEAGKQGIRRIPHGQAADDPALVQPGMIFVIDTGSPGGAGHTGLVERVEGGKLTTIEGNTNEGGGREGIGVFRRSKRKVNSINKGFIDYGRRV